MFAKLHVLMDSSSVLGLFLQVLPIALLAGTAYGLAQNIHSKRHGGTISRSQTWLRILFVCYLTALVNLLLVPANLWAWIWGKLLVGSAQCEIALGLGDFNVVPTIWKLFTGALIPGPWVLKMLAYNLLMFLPFGFLLSLVSSRVNRHTIWRYALIIPLSVELIQPIIGRSCDVDDLILNCAGILLGFCGGRGVLKLVRKRLYG